jgi:sporulation protein YlmC with PRC-barrel domain
MRRDRWTSIACLILLTAGAAGRAGAQQTGSDRGGRAELDEIRKLSALRKAEVLNQANEKIAGVSDLMLSPDGKVRYAILGVGGVVGIGAKYTAIPWDRLDARNVNGKWAVNLPMTKEVLEKAPMFESDNYRELSNPQWVARVREFFATQAGPAAARDKEPVAASGENPTVLLRASKILGTKLRNARDENLGSIEDLLLDRNARAVFAIIGHGGVLGIGENYIPAPWSKLQFSQRPDDAGIVAAIDSTKDQIEKAPLVKGNSYETMLAPGFTDQVCRYFGAEKH